MGLKTVLASQMILKSPLLLEIDNLKLTLRNLSSHENCLRRL